MITVGSNMLAGGADIGGGEMTGGGQVRHSATVGPGGRQQAGQNNHARGEPGEQPQLVVEFGLGLRLQPYGP